MIVKYVGVRDKTGGSCVIYRRVDVGELSNMVPLDPNGLSDVILVSEDETLFPMLESQIEWGYSGRSPVRTSALLLLDITGSKRFAIMKGPMLMDMCVAHLQRWEWIMTRRDILNQVVGPVSWWRLVAWSRGWLRWMKGRKT